MLCIRATKALLIFERRLVKEITEALRPFC
jgi:hypothetical protein